ncbi:TRAP transporter substrate-binding protein [Geminicoccaceae bacterium 1502E]|nr:TRAP transporter substrate-binding protein [Geminicoccaceae bacterium 1502E]
MVQRRDFMAGAAVAAGTAAASAFPSPAISQGRIEWRMVMAWPKGLPGLGNAAERLARNIELLSGGRIAIKLYGGGELVPPLQCLDAVSTGTADIAHDASYYHNAKSQAFAFYTTVPYGMTANELNAWVYWGEGQKLWDELTEPFGVRAFLCGNTGAQMGGWFRKEIKSLDDLQGLKFRMPGQGGMIFQRLGTTIVNLPGGEIFANLQSGSIDAADWVGPYNDIALGLHQVAKYYYWPGFQEPGAALQCMINRERYDALPDDLKAVVKTACEAENIRSQAEYNAFSAPALQKLLTEHGVQLRQWPRDLLEAFGRESGKLIEELRASDDPILKKITESYIKARGELMAWTRIGEQGFSNARLLDFPYPRS